MVDENLELQQWISAALINEKASNINICTVSTGNKGDGFVGGIYFVKVSTTKNNALKQYFLVIKHGKKGDPKRQNGIITKLFKREIFCYETVFKAFQEFEKSCKITDQFTAYPKYYGGFIFDDTEVIVLDNLKIAGFEMHDLKPMNWDHRVAICKEFAKFHAVSFAMRDKQPDKFNSLAKHLDKELVEEVFEKDGFVDMMIKDYEDHIKVLNNYGEMDLFNYAAKFTKNDLQSMFRPGDSEPYTCILHGDDWNNNFLFKYKNNKSKPDEVVMIDFQIAKVSSPVEEIVYFFYFNTEPERYDDEYKSILNLYYDFLSSYLSEFGCDANKLFPKALLMDHWKKYAKVAYIFAPLVYKMRLFNLENINDKGNIVDMLDFKLSDNDSQKNFEKSLLNYFKHFVNNRLV